VAIVSKKLGTFGLMILSAYVSSSCEQCAVWYTGNSAEDR
jgi:hypothetical protein